MSKVPIQDTKGALSKSVEQTLRMLCEWRNIEILEMNLKEDHIHMDIFDTSQIVDIRSNGNAKRQDSDKTLQELSWPQKEALLGKPFLESRILCEHYRFGREQN